MITLALTNYNRDEMLLRSFAKVADHPAISEIIISDDCSNPDIFNSVQQKVKDMPKVKLYRNEVNIGMSRNKYLAVGLASNERCILFDSDNELGNDYIDSIPEFAHGIIYAPAFAKPQFDYRQYAGETIDQNNISQFLDKPRFQALLNTCNYVVNTSEYLNTFVFNPLIKGVDTLWFNYLWLKAGKKIMIVQGMQYEHIFHEGSEWLKDQDYNLSSAQMIVNDLR